MSALLSNYQKGRLARFARAAYDRWSDREAYEAINEGMSKTACFEAWRRVETGKVVGIQSLRECTQDHYGRIKAHFLNLAGYTAQASQATVRDKDNDRRIARYKLAEALGERGLAEAYAAAICRTQFRCSLHEATAKQVWKLVFTIRNRRKAGTHATPAKAATDNDENPF